MRSSVGLGRGAVCCLADSLSPLLLLAVLQADLDHHSLGCVNWRLAPFLRHSRAAGAWGLGAVGARTHKSGSPRWENPSARPRRPRASGAATGRNSRAPGRALTPSNQSRGNDMRRGDCRTLACISSGLDLSRLSATRLQPVQRAANGDRASSRKRQLLAGAGMRSVDFWLDEA